MKSPRVLVLNTGDIITVEARDVPFFLAWDVKKAAERLIACRIAQHAGPPLKAIHWTIYHAKNRLLINEKHRKRRRVQKLVGRRGFKLVKRRTKAS